MRSSFVRAMTFQYTTKFLLGSRWVLGSLLFIVDKFRDLNLHEPESCEVVELGTGHLPPAPIRVYLVKEARLGHELIKLGKADPDPSGDKADHTSTVLAAIIDSIYQSSPESDSEGDREVYMVGHGDDLPKKTVDEIQREAEEKIARVARLARDAERGKRHNGLQDDTGASDDVPRDGAPLRRHHPKFNPRCPADRDQL
jgi:hypothetical protein